MARNGKIAIYKDSDNKWAGNMYDCKYKETEI